MIKRAVFLKLFSLSFVLAAAGPNGFAAVPAPEKLLPDDTLFVATIPDAANMREAMKTSPQGQLWNDPAMKPFKDKFMTKLREDFIKPLERDMNIRFDDFTGLPQGQVTLAMFKNSAPAKEEQFGITLLLDARERSDQLKTNLAGIRKKWVDANKPLKTEKIRDVEFTILTLSSNDVPKTLRDLAASKKKPAKEETAESEKTKSASKDEFVFGQAGSLLIVGESTRTVEKILARLDGGSAPTLSGVPSFESSRQALFREAQFYGWINARLIIDMILQKMGESKSGDDSNPFGNITPQKVLDATGVGALKALAFSYHSSTDGAIFQAFAGVPAAERKGLFAILPGEAKDASPPPFVPADALKFTRWRLDLQKTWAGLEKMLADISPQLSSTLDLMLDGATAQLKEKEPDFDIKKSLIGNLGDDIITYDKPSRTVSAATKLPTTSTLVLLGSAKPDQLAATIKTLASMGSKSDATGEREFLGRKIFSMAAPDMPFAQNTGKPAGQGKFYWAASSAYVALSSDSAMIEEYLRSNDSPPKPLRDLPGLADATQHVSGQGSALFGYENQAETMRATLALLKDASSTDASPLSAFTGALGMANAPANLKDWIDFSLLPPFEKISKYFQFAVYSGGKTPDGLIMKAFTPTPSGLKAK